VKNSQPSIVGPDVRLRREPIARDASRLKVAFDDQIERRDPLHLRLRRSLLAIIAEGHWSPGDKLPAERDIADELSISLGTVQKTLTSLAADGVLVRKHGYGTFVTGDATQSTRLIHFRFVGEDGESIAPVYAEAIDRKIVRERGVWSQFLNNSRSVILITRRINVADEFDCISDFYVDADEFAPIMKLPLEQLHKITIRELIASEYNAPTIKISQNISCGSLPERSRALLKLGRASAGMTLNVRSWTHGAKPISFQQIFIPAGVRPLEIPTPRLK
jgi:DNA-binding GntR family transcriptional regulator